ncbi:hypothetical protein AB6A40_003897 [Gnathostoma spinigerum]|uniref:RING-type E3 ubiquitin transferase BRCA1 n=1 Tax=Gnathostoma spinigerum TaxID=75299 RepID=A0ABD6EJN8_9BILA
MGTNEEVFLKIKGDIEAIKLLLRCGICYSTLKNPVVTACHHTFCKECFDECLRRISPRVCPLCRQVLNRRSCGESSLLSASVQFYLKLAKNFKKDCSALHVPKKLEFLESQAPITQRSPFQPKNVGIIRKAVRTLPTIREEDSHFATPSIPCGYERRDTKLVINLKSRAVRISNKSRKRKISALKDEEISYPSVSLIDKGKKETQKEMIESASSSRLDAPNTSPAHQDSAGIRKNSEEVVGSLEKRVRLHARRRKHSNFNLTALSEIGNFDRHPHDTAPNRFNQLVSAAENPVTSVQISPICNSVEPSVVPASFTQAMLEDLESALADFDGKEPVLRYSNESSKNSSQMTQSSVLQLNTGDSDKRKSVSLSHVTEEASHGCGGVHEDFRSSVDGSFLTSEGVRPNVNSGVEKIHKSSIANEWHEEVCSTVTALSGLHSKVPASINKHLPPSSLQSLDRKVRCTSSQTDFICRCCELGLYPPVTVTDVSLKKAVNDNETVFTVPEVVHTSAKNTSQNSDYVPQSHIIHECTKFNAELGSREGSVSTAIQCGIGIDFDYIKMFLLSNSDEEKSIKSRAAALLQALPWIPSFLGMTGEDVLNCFMQQEESCIGPEGSYKKKSAEGPSDGDAPSEVSVVAESIGEADETAQPDDEPTEPMCLSHEIALQELHADDGCVNSANRADRSEDKIYLMVSGKSGPFHEELLKRFFDAFPQVKHCVSLSREATHLAIFNSEGRLTRKRSVKYAFAIANRCRIVCREWIEHCLRDNRILEIDDYEIEGDIDVDPCARAAFRSRTDTSNLFSDYAFFVPQTFFEKSTVPYDFIIELIRLCGGRIVSKPWNLVLHKKGCIIFGLESDDIDAARRFESREGYHVLVGNWILDSVCQYSVLDGEKCDVYRVVNRSP